ncbi:MAG TPA: hypothetical protein VHL57_02805 [Flavobacteriales bacterium]|nr:hypothetical protein [Flavobacteriales bacterium]
MKKLFKVSALVLAATLLLSSCRSTHSCPAYGKVVKKPAAERNA